MARIKDSSIEAVKSAMEILPVVEDYVQLRKAGGTYKGLCPFHQERTPSFTVTPARGTFKCFGCGEGGDAISFVQRLDNLGEWCEQHLSNRVFLTKRALRAAAKSVHGDPQLIARCLLALDRWFVPMHFDGDAAAREAWLAFIARERLRDGPVGTAPDNHRTWDSYRVTFQGRRLALNRHLQGSSSRDITRTFRVYYALDKESNGGTVVIGSLPEHLPNTLT